MWQLPCTLFVQSRSCHRHACVPGVGIFCRQNTCLLCCRTCHLNTSTRSLSPTSPIFRPSSPSLSCPLELDQETLQDSGRSGGSTESASPTGYEPKMVQSDDFEPGRVDFDQNIGTDTYQIPEGILGDDYQSPITEDTEETGKFGVDRLYVQSRIHSNYDSAASIADSDLEDGVSRKMLASLLYVRGRGKFYGSSQKPTDSGKPEAKIMQKRGASAQRTQADHLGAFRCLLDHMSEPKKSQRTGQHDRTPKSNNGNTHSEQNTFGRRRSTTATLHPNHWHTSTTRVSTEPRTLARLA